MNSPYGSTAAAPMAPTVSAASFASLPNGFSNSTVGQLMMTPSGQMLSSLPAGFNENLANFKVALSSEQNSNSSLLLSSSSTIIKEDMANALQVMPLTFASTPTVNSVVNGSVKVNSFSESSFSFETAERKSTDSDAVTALSEVRILSSLWIY